MCHCAQVSWFMRRMTTLAGSWAVVDLRGRVPHTAFFRSFPLATRRAKTVHTRCMSFALVADQLCVASKSFLRETDLSPGPTTDLANLLPNTSLQTLTGPQIPSVGVLRHVIRLLPNLVRVAIASGSDCNTDRRLQLLLDGLPHLRHIECPETWMTIPVDMPDDDDDIGVLRLSPTLETLIVLHDGSDFFRLKTRVRDLVPAATPTMPCLHTLRMGVSRGYACSWNLGRTLATVPTLRDLAVDSNLCADPLYVRTLLALPGLERLKLGMNLFGNVGAWPPLPEQTTLRRLDLDVACDAEDNVTEGMRRILRSCTRMRELRVLHWGSELTDCLLFVIAEHMDRATTRNALRYAQLPPFQDTDEMCDAIAAPGSRPTSPIAKESVSALAWIDGSPRSRRPPVTLLVPGDAGHVLVPRPVDPARIDSIVRVEIHHAALRRILTDNGDNGGSTACMLAFSGLRNSNCRGLWHDCDAPRLVRGPKCCWDGTGARETVDYCAMPCVYDCICRAEHRKWRKSIPNSDIPTLRFATFVTAKNSAT
jgi:hypothetical protein